MVSGFTNRLVSCKPSRMIWVDSIYILFLGSARFARPTKPSQHLCTLRSKIVERKHALVRPPEMMFSV